MVLLSKSPPSAVLRSDLVMDVGIPLNPRIDIGQIEGAFIQGLGLFTMEEKVFLSSKPASLFSPLHVHFDGRDITIGPGAYKIPSFRDIPNDFRVHILRDAPNNRAVHSSKAIGEVVVMTANFFFHIREAPVVSGCKRIFCN